uniref:Uncharacterized protein n=1 Tax=Lepeophtheirus salmonis TaxID=72036 RepID=A0A0K2SYF6_LEPSM
MLDLEMYAIACTHTKSFFNLYMLSHIIFEKRTSLNRWNVFSSILIYSLHFFISASALQLETSILRRVKDLTKSNSLRPSHFLR